jgi:hypothetical protein
MPDPISNPQPQEQKQNKEWNKLKCPLCKCTFPNKEFYDSHHVIEAKLIADMFYEESPGFVDAMSKIEQNKREEKDIERQIKFIEETMQREAKFRQEQQQSEIEYRKGIEQRDLRNKKLIEELKSCYAAGLTPDIHALVRLASED